MWKIFGYKNSSSGDVSQHDIPSELSLKELRNELENRMRALTKTFQESESLFEQHLQAQPSEQQLTSTFLALITTLQGLNSIVVELKREYEQVQEQLQEHSKLKQMVDNHQDIVSALQDSQNSQVAALYQAKAKSQAKLQAEIESLSLENERIREELKASFALLQGKDSALAGLRRELQKLKSESEWLRSTLLQTQSKYQAVVGYSDNVEHRKVIDLDHLELQHMFYYSKLKHQILAFLGIRDLAHLQSTSKFFYSTLKKQQPLHTFSVLKKQFSRQMSREMVKAKEYEKIFELFPVENIKLNALKYLHFKIKPATYILPYLQEEQVEAHKKDVENIEKQKQGRFSWKTLFSDKMKLEKKEEYKFSLASLKQEDQFRRVEANIETMFKNILQFRMPEDLQDFGDTMERQLGELKTELGQLRGKGGQTEWTAQLCCLSRYMYHEINQLYNLLQVIFGELLTKNRDLINLRDSYDYLSENQLVLRNLIENLAGDKASIEKKLLVAESEVIRSQLEREAASHNCQRIGSEFDVLSRRLKALEEEHRGCKETIGRYQLQSRQAEDSMFAIREEIQALERGSVRSRGNSAVSAGEEDHN